MKRDLLEVQGEEDRAIWLHVSGKISGTQLDRQRKFIAEKSEILKAKLEEYRNLEAARTQARNLKETVSQWTESVRESLEVSTIEERRETLLHLLDHVTIDGENRVSFTLRIPARKLVAIEELESSSQLPNSDKTLRYSWTVQLQSGPDGRGHRTGTWRRIHC